MKISALVMGLAGVGIAAWFSRDLLVGRSEGIRERMRFIARMMDHARRNSLVDQDDDGEGEFVWIGELAGVDPLRGGRTRLVSPWIDPTMGKRDADGRSEVHGYLVHIALPRAQGGWVWESPKGDARAVAADADVQETQFVCYAWPSASNLTLRAIYFVGPSLEVWTTDGAVTTYRGSTAPRPSAAFVKHGAGPPTETTPPSYTGTDGNTWRVLDR